jgi:iron(III) transport system substrate-binding protein
MLRTLVLSFLAVMLSVSSAFCQTTLTVYSTLERDLIPIYTKVFKQEFPNVEIKWVRDSTGIITARLIAEKDAPKADLIFGLAVTSMTQLQNAGVVVSTPLKSKDGKIEQKPWIPFSMWANAVTFNKEELEHLGLPVPTTWKDLTDPKYKGHIVMPNPFSSGTGFMQVAAWLKMFGEEEGWKFMDALHDNIKFYTHSGTKPCAMSAQGEIAIGISSGSFADVLQRQGAPVTIVYPSPGIGWDTDVAASVAGSSQQGVAQNIVAFAASKKIAEIVGASSRLTPSGLFLNNETRKQRNLLIDGQVEFMMANKAVILAKWKQRYEGTK